MKDPKRLLRHPPTRLSRMLLEAGAEETPSAEVRRRAVKAVAAAEMITTVTTAAAAKSGVTFSATQTVTALGGTASAGSLALNPSAATLGIGVLAQWFGIGALGGVLAAPLMYVVSPAEHAVPARPPASVTSMHVVPPQRSSTPGRTAPQPSPLVLHGEDEPRRQAETSAMKGLALQRESSRSQAAPVEATPVSSAPAREGALLAAEIQFVEQGRAALQRGAFAAALARLAPYEARFPKPQLLTEVLFLRMEAYSRSGNVGRARTLAARLITRDVAGPQAASVHEVLGR